MQKLIKPWWKHLLLLCLFGIAINMIYLSLPIYMMIVYDKVLFSFSIATLATMIVGVLFSLSMLGLLDFCRSRMLAQIGNGMALQLMPLVLKGMFAANAGAQCRKETGLATEDLDIARSAIVQGQIVNLLDLPWVLIFLGILFWVHPIIGGVAAVAVFMIVAFQILLKAFEEKRNAIADLAHRVNGNIIIQSLDNAELVSAMGMQAPIAKNFLNRYCKVLAVRAESDAFQAGVGAAVRFLCMMALAGVFGAGAFVFISGKITTGALFAIVMVTVRILYPLEKNLTDLQITLQGIAALKRLASLVHLSGDMAKLSLPDPKGKFEAEGVSVASGGKILLQNVSFAVSPGESLGILGAASAGKSILCKALLGVLPNASGKVRLDGAELAQWPEEELRRFIGFVPQSPILFTATVAENISRFQDVDSEKVIRAAQKAGIHEMILQLPQGYDTFIDHGGKNLAAGQRQLISLARALYDEPKFIIMDEPHAHLDDAGFRVIVRSLETLKKEKITTIVVTDRTNLIMGMDKLLVLKDGVMAMFGPGKEVLHQLANRKQAQGPAGA